MSCESVLRMDRLFFEDINLQRKVSDTTEFDEYKYNFMRSIRPVDNDHFIVSLQCNIQSMDDEESLSLSIKATGLFECKVEDEAQKKLLIQQNAIAIMFPYLRSQIILVTTQPDMTPIQLPIFNIAALFDESNIKN